MVSSRLPIEGLRGSSLHATAVASDDAADEAFWLPGCPLVRFLRSIAITALLKREWFSWRFTCFRRRGVLRSTLAEA